MDTESNDRDYYRVLHVHPLAHPAVITAAYRALARLLHPDQTGAPTEQPMARVNGAYAVLRDPERRRAYDEARARPTAPSGIGANAPMADAVPKPPGPAKGSPLRHGRYQGWTLDQLVRHDPDYLRWLARHTSGRHHRAEIERLLAKRPIAGSRL